MNDKRSFSSIRMKKKQINPTTNCFNVSRFCKNDNETFDIINNLGYREDKIFLDIRGWNYFRRKFSQICDDDLFIFLRLSTFLFYYSLLYSYQFFLPLPDF